MPVYVCTYYILIVEYLENSTMSMEESPNLLYSIAVNILSHPPQFYEQNCNHTRNTIL